MKINAARAVVWVVSALMVSGCGPVSSSSSGSETPAPSASVAAEFAEVALVPESGSYLGMYYGDRSPAATDAAVGRTPQIHLTYFGWEDAWATDDTITADVARGQISLVNWEPFGVDFADIVDGTYDEMLTQRAEQAADLTRPVFLDFAAEMNEEEGWGNHDPALYIAAYRHLHDLFAGHDGGKVVWVWAPNNVDSDDAPAALDYYPGDAYVDWTGIDGYNWGTAKAGFAWQTFEEVFRDLYDDLHTLGKPIIIGETATAEQGGSKAEWIADIPSTLRDEFPDIRAVVWFDVDKERDWRVRSSTDSLAAFRELAADDQFGAPVR